MAVERNVSWADQTAIQRCYAETIYDVVMAMDMMKKRIALVVLLAAVGSCTSPGQIPDNPHVMVGLSIEECVARYGLEGCKVYVNPRSAHPRTGEDGNAYIAWTTTYYLPEGNLYLTEGRGIVVDAAFHRDHRTIEERIRDQQKRWSKFVESRTRKRP